MDKKFLKLKLKTVDKWVILLIGTPLVGKSTFIKEEFFDMEYSLLSRDETLLEVAGTDDYALAWETVLQKEVDRTLIDKFEKFSSDGKNCVVDMTNLSLKRRRKNLSYFDDTYYKVAVVFDFLSKKEYEFRNDKRSKEENKFIPFKVLENMIESYTPVSKDEGFDLIVY